MRRRWTAVVIRSAVRLASIDISGCPRGQGTRRPRVAGPRRTRRADVSTGRGSLRRGTERPWPLSALSPAVAVGQCPPEVGEGTGALSVEGYRVRLGLHPRTAPGARRRPRRHADRGSWDAREQEIMADRDETQVERYAPGFRDLIRARRILVPPTLESLDANLHGGVINGGTTALHQQLFFRPTPGTGRPEPPVPGLYLASASAHPGGGVHGAPGANAARAARGERLWSAVVIWPKSAKGASGMWPVAICAAKRVRASTPSARWTVPARAACGLAQGTGPFSAQSTLNAAKSHWKRSRSASSCPGRVFFGDQGAVERGCRHVCQHRSACHDRFAVRCADSDGPAVSDDDLGDSLSAPDAADVPRQAADECGREAPAPSTGTGNP